MADLTISLTVAQWNKITLAIYMQRPGLWDEGDPVIVSRIDSTPLLVSDGSAQNLTELSNADLLALISDGKPADDGLRLKEDLLRYWRIKVRAAKEARADWQLRNTANPLDDTLEET